MPEVIGIGGWVLLAVAAIVICGGVLLLWNRLGKPGRDGADNEGLVAGKGRLQILESAQVDAARRLVLVRCDNIEHLIMVGGGADVVVQHDIGHTRVMKAVAKPTEASPVRRTEAPRREPAAALEPDLLEVEAAPAEKREPQQPREPQSKESLANDSDEPKQSEPKRSAPQSDAAERAPRPNLAAVPAPPQPAGKNGQAVGAPSPPRSAEARPLKQRPQLSDQPLSRREPPSTSQPQPGPTHLPPVPGTTAPVASEMSQRVQPATLREATVQTEPSDMEGDIVRALHADQRSAAPQQAHKPVRALAVAAKPATDPTTTLGDLAERLEEALAREVQSAHQGRARLDLDLDAFAFDAGTVDGASEPSNARVPVPRPAERKAAETKAAPRGMAAAPEPDVRREPRGQSERQEEAPVISLNARRREAIDPLEDEMARLLGELTGDTNRR